jgi:cytochrome c5
MNTQRQTQTGVAGKARQRLASVLLPLALSAGCATRPADNSAAMTPEAQTFNTRCSTCHALPHPKRHSYAEWQTLVAAMERRMQERGVPPLDDRQRRDILAYLERNGR